MLCKKKIPKKCDENKTERKIMVGGRKEERKGERERERMRDRDKESESGIERERQRERE